MIAVLKTEVVKLDQLVPFPGNARVGDVDLIEESLRENGQFKAMVVNRRNNQVLGGNHLLHALLQSGANEGEVNWVDVDDAQATKINLVLNRAHDMGSYDLEALLKLASDGPLEGTGFDEFSMAILLERVNHAAPPEATGPEIEIGAPEERPDDRLAVRWGKRTVVVTEDELQELLKVHGRYRAKMHSDVGFGFHLVELREEEAAT